MKGKVKEYTSRSNAWGNDYRIKKLKQYIHGWTNYFKIADMKSLLKQTDEWMRRRIRMVFWKQWKRIKTKYDNLVKLGINNLKACEFANTRKGYWRTSGSPIMTLNGNRSRHPLLSELTPAQRAKEIRDFYKQRGSEYILPGEGI